jgi:hypothetical protein
MISWWVLVGGDWWRGGGNWGCMWLIVAWLQSCADATDAVPCKELVSRWARFCKRIFLFHWPLECAVRALVLIFDDLFVVQCGGRS